MSNIVLSQLNQHKKINGHNDLYNAGVGFKKFRRAYADLMAGNARIYNVVGLGDSLMEGGLADGMNGPAWPAKSWFGLIRQALASKFQDLGIGFIPVHYPRWQSWWTYGSGWTLVQGYDWKWGIGKSYASGSGDIVGTISVPFTGTKCQIITANGSSTGGKYTYNIDGGTESQVIDTSTGGDTFGLGIVTTNTVTQGAHMLTITKLADGKETVLFGILPQNSNTKGFLVHCNARWGTKVADFIKGGSGLNEGLEIDHWNPVLTIIALVANDAWQKTDIATYTDGLQQLISRAKGFGDVWLVNDGGSDATAGLGATTLPYANALLQLATQNDCAYSDLETFLGASGTLGEYGVQDADGAHLNSVGHQMLGTRAINHLFSSL